MDSEIDAIANTVSEEMKQREDTMGTVSNGADIGNLFNEGSEVHFHEGLFNDMEGAEALDIGFEESEIHTNEYI